MTYRCLRCAIRASGSMSSFSFCPVVFRRIVGRCRTPSGRFNAGSAESFVLEVVPLMSLVACSVEFLWKVRRVHLKYSGERHFRIGHGENMDISKRVRVGN